MPKTRRSSGKYSITIETMQTIRKPIAKYSKEKTAGIITKEIFLKCQ